MTQNSVDLRRKYTGWTQDGPKRLRLCPRTRLCPLVPTVLKYVIYISDAFFIFVLVYLIVRRKPSFVLFEAKFC